jgi:hypothetical protein
MLLKRILFVSILADSFPRICDFSTGDKDRLKEFLAITKQKWPIDGVSLLLIFIMNYLKVQLFFLVIKMMKKAPKSQ